MTAVLDRALAGETVGLVVRGEAGIGKSALLAEAAMRAGEREMTVLHVRGVEAEADIPFAGLTGLLAPVIDLRDRLAPAWTPCFSPPAGSARTRSRSSCRRARAQRPAGRSPPGWTSSCSGG